MFNFPFSGGITTSSLLSAIMGGTPGANKEAVPGSILMGTGLDSSLLGNLLDPVVAGPLDMTTLTGGSDASNPVTKLLSGGGLFSISDNNKQAGTYNATLGMLAGSGSQGTMLQTVLGGDKVGDAVGNALQSILGNGMMANILSGGAPTALDKESSLGKALGNTFDNMNASGGILGSLLKDINDGSGTITSSLLTSSAGKAEMLGGSSKVLQEFFGSLHGKPAGP